MKIPISALLEHFQKGKTIYKVHSPFLFRLLQFIKDPERIHYAYAPIERERRKLLKSSESVKRVDYGAGSRNTSSRNRLVRDIARTDLSSERQCREMFRLVDFAQAENILELGTSLGISTAYIASANTKASVNTLEGDKALTAIATGVAHNLNLSNIRSHTVLFKDFISKIDTTYDLIFLDGHHTYKHTVDYAMKLEHHLRSQSYLIVDDIYWSSGMVRAWKELVNTGRWNASLTFHNYGILIKNPYIHTPTHIHYLPTWLKPWQIRFSI